MINFFKKHKNTILNLSLKKIYSHFFLNDSKKNGYFDYLNNLVFEFLITKYPNYEKKVFENKLNSLIKGVANYRDLGKEIDTLFNPEFDKNLEFHYKYNERKIFFEFILYSLNKKLISKKYAEIYNFGISEIKKPLNILEIGGGIPHGLIYNIWEKDKNFVKNFTYVDANLLHAEFVRWYCKKSSIPSEIKLFMPSKTPLLESLKFNFVFAKDIFEHLDTPEILIDYLISNTYEKETLLCLDLEHKGDKIGQHISPNLPVLKRKLIENNFQVINKFGEVHVWKKK
jgi:hypothetical protein